MPILHFSGGSQDGVMLQWTHIPEHFYFAELPEIKFSMDPQEAVITHDLRYELYQVVRDEGFYRLDVTRM